MRPFGKLSKGNRRSDDSSIVERVKAARLTFLDVGALHDLYEAVSRIERAGLRGQIVEAGCALGGSAIVMASAKARLRRMTVYDVFGLSPPPSERDGSTVQARWRDVVGGKAAGIEGDSYYGYRGDLYREVRTNFARFGIATTTHRISMVRGQFSETLHINGPVALAHIDADWFDSIKVCLERIVPHLVQGGTLVIDDYEHWAGCKDAVDEYFAVRKSEFEFVKKSRLHIVKR